MLNPNRGNSSLNTLVGIIDNALSRVSTAMPVEVIQVYDNHTVDVMPMISMLDNEGKTVDHAPLTGLPYARLQGGDYGLIIEPKVGDKGLVVFASRDISNTVENKQKSAPASLRKHSMSDGMYIASLLYEKPETYLQIEKDKVTIHSKELLVENNEKITFQTKEFLVENNEKTTISTVGQVVVQGTTVNIIAENIVLTGKVTITGDVAISGDAVIGGISFKDHVHGNGHNGMSTSPPQK